MITTRENAEDIIASFLGDYVDDNIAEHLSFYIVNDLLKDWYDPIKIKKFKSFNDYFRSCNSKVGSYDTEFYAGVAASRTGMVPYRCRYCKHWHISKKKVKI